ncbi:arginine--tRNA ligase [Eubacterium oxidoreducens]|uniref:Arginine--tRNA ligase n=1 Tax=Eubacterium oxidoreducens TaxID=1732 RepID=A0A1G6AX90_EUBOX|nr:arginine--tRNA ligase [Eubacterium oxidoreducens]SDB12934.1 arginyl-tRNA synthetase [Eubacterium oxidoreducens]
MKYLLDLIGNEIQAAFAACGYDTTYAKATISNRPDLCEFQCNGAMPLAKSAHKAPIMIAEEIAQRLKESVLFETVEAVKPGFLNLRLNKEALSEYLSNIAKDEKLGVNAPEKVKKIMIDYGGPNVAKPLHVGHLRSAIIGESVKRLGRYVGHEMIGDVHLGDWGLQMGLIITELKERKPDLVYFDENYEGEYPSEAPFTISELEEIYPTASAKSKEDEKYKEAAMQATYELQHGRRGYQAVLAHILDVSVTDLKKNYENLKVSFDLWKGESDAQPYIADMAKKMQEDGYAYSSEGALVVDVKEETDAKEIPPCMILKSDGASLYTTTDLATLVWRQQDYQPDQVIYVVDKRQELHFVQVFRCAKKTKIVPEDMELTFLGFGTMNGKDGKPFKTREGGVMRLENLVADTNKEMYRKIVEGGKVPQEEADQTSKTVALAAIKYGDLSNQASKDYVFDVDRFTSFEGNTGPYILYTMVRIKSIMKKYQEQGGKVECGNIMPAKTEAQKSLMLILARWNEVVENAFADLAPHKICAYIYEVANALNHFYHETSIMGEEDETKKAGYIRLLNLTLKVLEDGIEILGFEAPERM